MILRFYPTKDATLYEQYPTKNTGLDAILEINKLITKTSTGSYNRNSRAIVEFDFNGKVKPKLDSLGLTASNLTYTFKLYATTAEEIPVDYTLECYPLSSSWNMGTGRDANNPITTNGVSWQYRLNADDTTTAWITQSYSYNTTASFTTIGGGGNWYITPVSTQSYSYTTTDATFNVTSIISASLASSITGWSGFIIKKSTEDETSSNVFSSLKFFSKDSHTVFSPVLEVGYDDSTSTSTLSVVDTNQEYVINPVNLQSRYRENSIAKIYISVRPKYPTITFSTSSVFLDRYRLPSGSQYAIYNANSDDVIIDFSNFTKLSDDSNGNFFKLNLDNFQPERYYRLLLKVPYSGSLQDYMIQDNNWIFNVSRV